MDEQTIYEYDSSGLLTRIAHDTDADDTIDRWYRVAHDTESNRILEEYDNDGDD